MEEFLNPKAILNQLKIREDMVAADFGSGSGGWAISLAKRLKEGRIFAIDILEEPLSALKSKARLEKIFNIETTRRDLEKGSGLRDNSLDLILATNLLFQIENKKNLMREIKRVLKKGGKILIVDWLPEAPLGPEKGRVSPEEVKETAKEFNLRLEKEFEAGIYHWGLILEKL